MADPIHVAGAGIAGTAVALALHDTGADVVLHEARPHGAADAGAFLTLSENGMRALHRLGVDAAVRAASAPLRRMHVHGADGTELFSRPLGDGGGPGYRYLTRARLCTVLRDQARRRGIVVRHGSRLAAAEPGPGRVTAVFADGTRATGALLIGADGLHSRVRTIIDPDAAPPRDLGQRVYYGYADRHEPGEAVDRIRFARGGVAFGSIATARDGTWWFARIAGAEPTGADAAADPAAHLAAALRNQPGAHAIVRASRQVLVTRSFDLARVRTWHRDRMLIIGDAAHAASPATGQGAAMALEDAAALAAALARARDPAAAFAAYEQERRERVEANTAASAAM